MAPVIKALKRKSADFDILVCATAQHREMLDQVFRTFQIAPDFDLNLMAPNQELADLTSRVILKMNCVLTDVKPDILLIQGDTTTVMAAALTAFYHKIPVGHVEAGLRTANPYSPFPEEMNRRLTSALATYHFAPTEHARKALIAEGRPVDRIFLTGNTGIDALHWILKQAPSGEALDILERSNLTNGRKMILVTAHRRENHGRPFENICLGLRELARRNPGIAIVYPVHRNPNVRRTAFSIISGSESIYLYDAVSHDTIIHLMKRASFILTDSGGIQEEAPALGKPVLVLREETERPEGVQAGVARIIGTRCEAIVAESERLLKDKSTYDRMARAVSPYGDGRAAIRIAEILSHIKR